MPEATLDIATMRRQLFQLWQQQRRLSYGEIARRLDYRPDYVRTLIKNGAGQLA